MVYSFNFFFFFISSFYVINSGSQLNKLFCIMSMIIISSAEIGFFEADFVIRIKFENLQSSLGNKF